MVQEGYIKKLPILSHSEKCYNNEHLVETGIFSSLPDTNQRFQLVEYADYGVDGY